jgi:hypothetical protein
MRFRNRLTQWKTELDRWEETTIGADFPDVATQQTGESK